MEEPNKEIEEVISSSIAYELSKNMLLSQKGTRKMVEIAQRYGLSERAAVLMVLEFIAIEHEE